MSEIDQAWRSALPAEYFKERTEIVKGGKILDPPFHVRDAIIRAQLVAIAGAFISTFIVLIFVYLAWARWMVLGIAVTSIGVSAVLVIKQGKRSLWTITMSIICVAFQVIAFWHLWPSLMMGGY